MRAGTEIRQDIDICTLRKQAKQEKSGRVAARILAIANVLDGAVRHEAAEQCGLCRRSLQYWIKRYNAAGIEGLRDAYKGNQCSKMTAEQTQEVAEMVETAPPEPLVRWRCADLRDAIKQKFGVEYHERSIGKILHRLGFARISVRPLHPKSDAEKQEDFKKTSQTKSPRSSPSTPKTNQSSSGFRTKLA